jgi:ankyrin repeat protein
MKLVHRVIGCAAIAILCAATPSAQGPRPLIDAVKRGDHAAVRTLLRNKALVNQPEADGTTALHYAVEADDAQLVSMLIAGGANRQGAEPLWRATADARGYQRQRAGDRAVAEGRRRSKHDRPTPASRSS